MEPMLVGVGTALGAHRYRQEELIEGFRGLWSADGREFAPVERFHRAVCVAARHLALPMEAYPLRSFGEAARVFLDAGTDLAERATAEALDAARFWPADVDALFFTTVTGVAAPTLDVRLANRLRFRSDLKRLPFFGFGCVGGASGLARVYDYLLGWPDHVAVLLSVELCSLGESAMGWEVGAAGFSVVLSPTVPMLVRENIGKNVDEFLTAHGLRRSDIRAWICHPGGPKILNALAETLELEQGELDLTWRCLRDLGNISSASATARASVRKRVQP